MCIFVNTADLIIIPTISLPVNYYKNIFIYEFTKQRLTNVKCHTLIHVQTKFALSYSLFLPTFTSSNLSYINSIIQVPLN